MNSMGVVAHEFGHNLGLPDYYDTNTEDDITYQGTGRWDMMASGTYNGSPSGSSPAHHNPFKI
jgi:M6 family metalloprotease-like protein